MKNILNNTLFLKTILFILGVTIFFYYWYILGTENAFVGVAVVKGALTLLNKDLTANPIRNSFIFFIAFLYIGVFSYLGALNIYLGLFINLFALFFITYLFVSNLNQSIWTPFVLGYLFLLVKPVHLIELPKRLIALCLGSLFIMISQFILNRSKSQKKLNDNLLALLSSLSTKIDHLIEKNNSSYKSTNVDSSIDNIISTVYNRRLFYFYINDTDNIILNISLCIERLSSSIDDYDVSTLDDSSKEFFKDLSNLVLNMSSFIKERQSLNNLISEIDSFKCKYSNIYNNNYFLYDIVQNLSLLRFSLSNLLKASKSNCSNKPYKTNFKVKLSSLLKLNFNRGSLKFTYAFRLSLLLSVSYFLVELFRIPQGKWITFTIFAVLQPYIETSTKRFGVRFKGTIIALLLFAAIDLLVANIYLEILIFIVLYYIFIITSKFEVRTICAITVGTGVFSLITKSPLDGVVYRFIFVTIGIIISYLGNKYIFPYSLKDALSKLIKSYYSISNNMVSIGFNSSIDMDLLNKMNKNMMLSKLYESKILLNNSSLNISYINDFVYNQRLLNENIYYLFYETFNGTITNVDLNKLKDLVHLLSNCTVNSNKAYELLKSSKKDFNLLTTNTDRIFALTSYRILYRLKTSKDLIYKIKNTEFIYKK
ncbi:MAG: FUSC family protein [Clostridium sp.]|uniref:FUSC family protein n=1 Tax=Clostridium sp. TaxID=1506 RepID=UPI003F32F6C6